MPDHLDLLETAELVVVEAKIYPACLEDQSRCQSDRDRNASEMMEWTLWREQKKRLAEQRRRLGE